MIKRSLFKALTVLALSFNTVLIQAEAVQAQSAPDSLKRPNILVILSDDMGISDIGCYGGEIETPQLDSLARQGVRMRGFYNTARCCPTRACILTGLYPHQAGIGHMMNDRGLPGYRGDLNDQCVTIAQVLRPAGYRTCAVGKWHVTKHITDKSNISNWPIQRGFDDCYSALSGAGNYFQPYCVVRGNEFVSTEADPDYAPPLGTYYVTDAFTDNAIAYLKRYDQENQSHPDQAKPFFLYLTYTAAHWPMQALPEDIAKYRGKFDAGWDSLRQSRLERMKRFGVVPESTPLSPRANESPAWDSLSAEDKAWFAARMEVYAAIVDRMDQGIGRIVDYLKQSGQFDNTLILYIQDNGACAEEIGSLGPICYAGKKSGATAHSRQKPMAKTEPSLVRHDKWTREGLPVKTGRVTPGPVDTYISYGLPWANLSDTPFKLFKHFVHEGGIRTPLIASWPNGLKHQDWVDGPGHLIDVMATCVDAGQAQYPKQFNGIDIIPMEGVSLIPALNGQPLHRPAPLFWEHEGNRAIRDGKWKLVARGWKDEWHLFNLETDPTELTDLADRKPKLVKRLAEQWETWAHRTNVYPR